MEHVCACMYVCTGNMGTHSPTAVKPAGRDSACSRLGGCFLSLSFLPTYYTILVVCSIMIMEIMNNSNNSCSSRDSVFRYRSVSYLQQVWSLVEAAYLVPGR